MRRLGVLWRVAGSGGPLRCECVRLAGRMRGTRGALNSPAGPAGCVGRRARLRDPRLSAALSWRFGLASQFLLVVADALQGAQVDQHVDQGVLVGDGRLAAQVGRSMPRSTAWLLMRSSAVRCL